MMDIKQILVDHKLWAADPATGKRADLRGADLSSADLRGAHLFGADLRGADLSSADLRGADLSSANLRGADLSSADLNGADLSSADLNGAHLFGADLSSADLRGADLSSANLSSANLRGAKLDSPIYQFYLGKYHAVATKDYLRIGCEVHSWDNWLLNYGEIGTAAKFSQAEIVAHGKVIKLYYELLTGVPE